MTTYPAVTGDLSGETVTVDYDGTTGLPVEMSSSLADYATGATYSPFGEPQSTKYQTGTGNYLQQTRKYDDATRRLSETLIDREVAPTSVSDLHYTYNQAGTITSTSDSTTGDTQCFSYDYLNRLSEAWTPDSNTNCDVAASTSTLGGPAPDRQSYSYDASGNRTQLVNHASLSTNGVANSTTYNYPAAGSGAAAHPHQCNHHRQQRFRRSAPTPTTRPGTPSRARAPRTPRP